MGVKPGQLENPRPRIRQKRRGKRMNSRVPVRLEWETPSGNPVCVEAHTRVVNSFGCMVVLRQSLELEHRLALTNLATQARAIAVIVWKSKPQPDGWEYGVELVSPELDFWGLEL